MKSLWKGNISFGLINIPVMIVPAENTPERPQFSLIDRRDHAHIGYLKINKNTGKQVSNRDIVKGLKLASGKYTIFTNAELDELHVKGSQTIELQQFVRKDEIEPAYFETPYYLMPQNGGEKAYALLRDALERTEKYGVGLIVLHNKQHLALIGTKDSALMVELVRYAEELRDPSDYDLIDGKSLRPKISATELAMAERLVEELTSEWKPGVYKDTYVKGLRAAVRRKSRATVPEPKKGAVQARASNVLDLMPLLEKSLRGKRRKKSV
ncbi:MAG: Ku protein [Oligoflexia bacterium]|nr:Ku protein [Oligoflexia bacterium]